MRRGKPSIVLFIEGESSEAIASLRQGFNKLFSQVLAGKMPRIIMGDGLSTTVNKFKKNKRQGTSFLLVDLDTTEAKKADRLQELDLKDYDKFVFWMVQEMEAWFLSQHEVIDNLYGKGTAAKLTKKRPQEFKKPSVVLMDITRASKKGKYNKVKNAVEFLEKLDAIQLRKDFPEFDRLVVALGG